MGDTCSAAHTQSSDCRAYFQQRSLGTFDAANSSGVPGNAPPQQEGGATAHGQGSVQPEKMKPGPLPSADIIQQRPPQMPRADGVEERGNPVLHDHRIIRTGSGVKVKTVVEPFAAPTRHRHPNTALTDGRKVTKELFRSVLAEELEKLKTQLGEKRFAAAKFDAARKLFDEITTNDEFVEFLTLPGYELLD